MQKTSKTKKLLTSAMMIAIATVLAVVCQLVPFLNLPFGGGFTIASMLPIVLVSYMYGIGWGVGAAFTYAVVQMLLGASTVTAFFLPTNDNYAGSIGAAIGICLIDYVLAYTVLGLGGVFRKMKSKTAAIVLGVVLALSLRYIAHIISGYIFFGAWAEWFFTQEGFYTIGNTFGICRILQRTVYDPRDHNYRDRCDPRFAHTGCPPRRRLKNQISCPVHAVRRCNGRTFVPPCAAGGAFFIFFGKNVFFLDIGNMLSIMYSAKKQCMRRAHTAPLGARKE